jgi:hypothetical protein
VLQEAELSEQADSENDLRGSSETIGPASDLTFTKKDQHLREGCGWLRARGGESVRHGANWMSFWGTDTIEVIVVGGWSASRNAWCRR